MYVCNFAANYQCLWRYLFYYFFITLSQGLVQPCHCLNHCKQPCHKLVKDFYSFVIILCQERLLDMLKFVHIATG